MLAQHLRHALGHLRRRPVSTILILVILALGIGANTALYSVLDAVVVGPLPFAEPESLVVPVVVAEKDGIDKGNVAYPDFLDWRAQGDLFEQMAVIRFTSFDVVGRGEPVKVDGMSVSEDYFPLTRVRPLLGRSLMDDDYADGAGDVVVLGEEMWRSRFGGRDDVLGQRLRLSDVPHTVVGVVREHDMIPSSPKLWVPFKPGRPLPEPLTRRDNFSLRVLARLRDGVGRRSAEARLVTLAENLAAEMPDKRGGISVRLLTLKDYLLEAPVRTALFFLVGAVFAVLMIVCFNIASLQLAKAVERRREVSVRLALGASRGQLLGQLAAESLILSVGAAALGLVLAAWVLPVLRAMAPPEMPGLAELDLDGSVLAFAVLLAAVATAASGMAPVWRLAGSRLSDHLRTAAGGAGDPRGRRTVRFLVAAEVAVSLVLLVVAAVMIRSAGELAGRDGGVAVERRLGMTVELPRARYGEKPSRDAFYVKLLASVRGLPGVRRVAASAYLPLGATGGSLSRVHLIEGHPEPPDGPEYRAYWNVVSPEYFRTLGIPLLRGRDLDASDSADAVPVIILNKTMAERMFPGEDPLGRRIRSWRDENVLRTVVGVVGDVRFKGLRSELQPLVYVPYTQVGWPRLTQLVVQTEGDPRALIRSLHAAVWGLDPALPLPTAVTLEEVVGESVARERYLALVLSVFSGLALLLAALGIYGVIACSVSRRTREIGLRMALGAGRADVLGLVLRQGMGLVVAGAWAGLVLSVVLGRAASSLVVGTGASEPRTYLAGAAVLGLAALVACVGPARRATRVDPWVALRDE